MNYKHSEKLVANLTLIGSLCVAFVPSEVTAKGSGKNSMLEPQFHRLSVLSHLQNQATKGDAKAQYNLAKLYLDGVEVKQDMQKARQLIESSAQLGNADAQFALGLMYASGDGIGVDRYMALKWLERSANQGNRDASFMLMTMQNSGIDIGC